MGKTPYMHKTSFGKSLWKANVLATLRQPLTLYAVGGHGSGFKFIGGDEFVYLGCRTINGDFCRVFDYQGVQYFAYDNGYLQDYFEDFVSPL